MKGINLKSEKGEAVIEATLIYPIVFFVVGFIILFGLYEMQGVLEYSCAQYIANYTSKLVTEPGYENYGEINNNDIDFKSVNDFNDEEDKFHANIYRRINFNGISQSEMEGKLKGMVNSGRLLKINTTDCSVKFKRTILKTLAL